MTPGRTTSTTSSVSTARAGSAGRGGDAAPGILEALAALPGPVRAWPGREGGAITFECRDDQGRLRAGHLDPHGRPELLPYATDPALPSLSPDAPGALVVHRAGRRAVLLGADRVRKATRPGRARPGAGALAAIEAFRRSGLRVPRILDAGPSHIDLELVPGRSLGELGDAGLAGWQRLVEAWGSLPDRSGDTDLSALPVHGPDREAAVLRGWFERARDHGVLTQAPGAGPQGRALDLAQALAPAVDRACAGLLEGPGSLVAPDAMVLSHRDLHDGQLLWSGQELSLIDMDTPALAEPALDLGNLLAHVELMALQGRLSRHGHDRVRGLLESLASSSGLDPARIEAYRGAAALRLVFVHAFRPGAQAWLTRWAHRGLATYSHTGNGSTSCV